MANFRIKLARDASHGCLFVVTRDDELQKVLISQLIISFAGGVNPEIAHLQVDAKAIFAHEAEDILSKNVTLHIGIDGFEGIADIESNVLGKRDF